MDAVVGRLDKVLRREWFTHVQTLPTRHAQLPTFQDFAAWIQQKSHIARLDRSSRFDRDKYKPTLGQAHADAVPKAALSRSTPPSSSQAAQTRKMRSPIPKVQQRTPGGDKEYRDATRNNRNPPYAPTFNNNMPEEIHLAPKCPKKPRCFTQIKRALVCLVHRKRPHPQSHNCQLLYARKPQRQ